jgi:hypothetical protein
MASVYLAEDVKHERKVALKILRPELAAVLGFLNRYNSRRRHRGLGNVTPLSRLDALA